MNDYEAKQEARRDMIANLFVFLSLLWLLFVIALDIHLAPYPIDGFVLFEDGSFIFEFLSGCIPLTGCN